MARDLDQAGYAACVQTATKYRIMDERLLQVAATHKSYGIFNSEKLEFLGDSALGFLASIFLCSRFPMAQEGNLSRMKALVIGRLMLCEIAQGIGITIFYHFSHLNTKLLSDVVESLIGTLFLDGGLCPSYAAIHNVYCKLLGNTNLEFIKDPRTLLHELLQHNHPNLSSCFRNHYFQYKFVFVLESKLEFQCREGLRFIGVGKESGSITQASAELVLTKLLVLAALNHCVHQRT